MLEELLGDFKSVSKTEWKEKIIADLKGKAYEDLLWQAEGIHGGPAYTTEDLEAITNLGSFQNNNTSGDAHIFGTRHWVNYQSIAVQEEVLANKTALEALNLGADGLFFQLETIPDFEKLLKGIQLQYCAVAFNIEKSADTLLAAYTDYIKTQDYNAHDISGFISSAENPSTCLASTEDDLPNFKTVNIALPDVISSANVVQELGVLLHTATTEITEQVENGTKIDHLFKKTQFQLRLGDNYFIEIAKVRAARVLIRSLFKGFGLEVNAEDISILSASGKWMEAVEDDYNYLLKGTTQAMSAIIGGCNALLLYPFDKPFKDQPILANRIARNISSILKDESYLDKVVDPSAGSYFIESLTNQLIGKAWVLFLEFEKQPATSLSLEKLNELTSKHNAS